MGENIGDLYRESGIECLFACSICSIIQKLVIQRAPLTAETTTNMADDVDAGA